jgi:hypothetical protein
LADGFSFKNEDGAAFYGGAAMSFNNRYGNRFTAGVEYLKKQFGYGRMLIPVEQFTAEGGFLHSFLSDRGKNVFLSAGVSALAVKKFENGIDRLPKNKRTPELFTLAKKEHQQKGISPPTHRKGRGI